MELYIYAWIGPVPGMLNRYRTGVIRVDMHDVTRESCGLSCGLVCILVVQLPATSHANKFHHSIVALVSIIPQATHLEDTGKPRLVLFGVFGAVFGLTILCHIGQLISDTSS